MLVVIAAIFLIILTGAAYQYFKMSADTQIWTKEKIQASLTAQAGVNLATHMLVAGASLPTDTLPVPILGTESTPFDLPYGMGSVYATVDPSRENKNIILANAFMITCIAWTAGSQVETYGMKSIIMPVNLARFAVFMDEPSLDGYYGDGYRFDGPFYANGPVRIYSESQGSTNDVFFYSFNLTSDYYIYGTGGTTQATTPIYGKLQMRPIERLSMGAPYFELGVEPIPFGASELNWQGVRSAAISGGLYLDNIVNGARLALKEDTLFVKLDSSQDSLVYPLAGLSNPVIWIENSALDHVFIRGNQLSENGLDMALTIGGYGDFYLSGPLYYMNPDPQDPENENLLGIMSIYGDIRIADDPETAENEWGSEMFKIDTDNDFTFSSVIVALSGVLDAEEYREPAVQSEFRLVGGYMIQEEGYTGTGGPTPKGFVIGVYFDPRLLYMHPPFFPTTANWTTIMWAEVPDMTVADVTNGGYAGY